MNTDIIDMLLSGLISLIVAAITSFFTTKIKERAARQTELKFTKYTEFISQFTKMFVNAKMFVNVGTQNNIINDITQVKQIIGDLSLVASEDVSKCCINLHDSLSKFAQNRPEIKPENKPEINDELIKGFHRKFDRELHLNFHKTKNAMRKDLGLKPFKNSENDATCNLEPLDK